MPHAYDPEVHNPDNRLENEDELPRHDVVFVGSGFSERMEILKTVDWEGLGIDLGLYGQWPYLHKNDRLYKYIKGGVTDNRLTAALYRNARVGLNIYRQSVGQSKNATRLRGAESLNPRALELAAIGVPHVSDVRPEVSEVFGDLVPTFDPYIRPRDPDTDGSLARAVVDLLHNSAHQKRMREELPERVREWTFDKRVDLLEAQMAAFMREGRAPLVTPVNSQLILPGR
jgi:glycosyltransferase involved in cell wall biosynthesis